MYDDLPTAQRVKLRLSEYLALAAQGLPNTNETIEAQKYARKNFLGLDGNNPNSQPSGDTRKAALTAYSDFVTDVVRATCGAEFHYAANHETTLGQIKLSHPGIYHTTRKVGVNIGAIPACSPSGK